jgi:hypothetical protein
MSEPEKKCDLEDRVRKFSTLELPGQPTGVHMGTSYLVNDLWREVQRLRREEKHLRDLVQAYSDMAKSL